MALIRSAFQDELDGVSQSLVDLTNMVSESIVKASKSLLSADLNLAEDVIATDAKIDDFQHDLDTRIIDIIARQQPVASDLRALVTALRMSADLERMGDLAHHIAKVARLRYPESAIPAELRGTLLEMGQIAELVVQKAGSALVSRDRSLFDQIERDDDRMDALHRKLFTLILDDSWEHGVEGAIDVTLISRYYERFADHAVSVARRVANDF